MFPLSQTQQFPGIDNSLKLRQPNPSSSSKSYHLSPYAEALNLKAGNASRIPLAVQERQLNEKRRKIRLLGYTYIKGPGIYKTMQAKIDQEEEENPEGWDELDLGDEDSMEDGENFSHDDDPNVIATHFVTDPSYDESLAGLPAATTDNAADVSIHEAEIDVSNAEEDAVGNLADAIDNHEASMMEPADFSYYEEYHEEENDLDAELFSDYDEYADSAT